MFPIHTPIYSRGLGMYIFYAVLLHDVATSIADEFMLIGYTYSIQFNFYFGKHGP